MFSIKWLPSQKKGQFYVTEKWSPKGLRMMNGQRNSASLGANLNALNIK